MKLYGVVAVLGALSLSPVNGFDFASLFVTEAAQATSTNPQLADQSGRPATITTDNQNQKSSEPADNAVMYRPGAGTIVVAELTKSVEARKVNIGDLVECKVTQDLLYQGRIIVPRDARVVGHVTEVTVSSKAQRQSSLGLIFEKIVLKDKRELVFQHPAMVEAVGAPIRHIIVPTNRLDQMPVQMEKGKSTGNSAMDALQSNPNLVGANFPDRVGAISGANRGVVGLKELTLDKKGPDESVIVSRKGDVKLAAQTQMVLRVIDPAKY